MVAQKTNKLVIILLNALGFNAFGIDRMYSGCVKSGFLKLGLLIIAFLCLFYINPIVAAVFGSLWFIFYLFDIIKVVINALTRSKTSPYCQKYKVDESSIQPAFYIVFIVIAVQLFLNIAAILNIKNLQDIYDRGIDNLEGIDFGGLN
jgi:TM2 domain-containing membrane protein YozV